MRRLSSELGRQVRQVAPEALQRLRQYSWPGNIRELESVLKQALLQANGPVLLAEFLPEPRKATPDGGPVGSPSTVSPVAPADDPGVVTFHVRQRLGSDVRDLYAQQIR